MIATYIKFTSRVIGRNISVATAIRNDFHFLSKFFRANELVNTAVFRTNQKLNLAQVIQ